MSSFEDLNKSGAKLAEELADERKRKAEANEKEIQKFVDYVTSMLEPDIKKIVEEFLKTRKHFEKSVNINKIIFGYKQTPYIKNRFKSVSGSPIFNFVRGEGGRIEKYFKEELSSFRIYISFYERNILFIPRYYVRVTIDPKDF